MRRTYPLHPCELPGCDVLHNNAHFCCQDHRHRARILALATQTRQCKFCGQDHPAADFVVPGGKKKRSKWCATCRDRVPADKRADVGNAEMQARQRAELWVDGLRLGHPEWPVGPNSIQGAPFGA